MRYQIIGTSSLWAEDDLWTLNFATEPYAVTRQMGGSTSRWQKNVCRPPSLDTYISGIWIFYNAKPTELKVPTRRHYVLCPMVVFWANIHGSPLVFRPPQGSSDIVLDDHNLSYCFPARFNLIVISSQCRLFAVWHDRAEHYAMFPLHVHYVYTSILYNMHDLYTASHSYSRSS